MAIAVPFIASAMGASAVVSTAISIGFAVTGISAKIDKAASKVFGTDLVKFANIAGSAFAVYNGGFSLDSFGEAAASTAPSAADIAFEADWMSAADGSGGLMAGESLAGATDGFNLSQFAADNTDAAFEADWADMQAGKEAISEVNGLDLTTGKATGVDSKAVAEASKAAAPDAPKSAAVEPVTRASGATAQTAGATGASATAADATQGIGQAWDSLKQTGENVFMKLFADKNGVIDKKLVGAALQAGGGAYAAASQNKIARQKIDEEQRRYAAVPQYRLT